MMKTEEASDRFSSDPRRRGRWEALEYVKATGRPVVNLYRFSGQWSYTGRKRPRQERPSALVVATTASPTVVAITHWRDSDIWEGMSTAEAQREAEDLTRKLTCKHERILDVPAVATLGATWRLRAYGGYHRGTDYIRHTFACECGQRFEVVSHYREGNRIMLHFGPVN